MYERQTYGCIRLKDAPPPVLLMLIPVTAESIEIPVVLRVVVVATSVMCVSEPA
jgi:hypothetical protein